MADAEDAEAVTSTRRCGRRQFLWHRMLVVAAVTASLHVTPQGALAFVAPTCSTTTSSSRHRHQTATPQQLTAMGTSTSTATAETATTRKARVKERKRANSSGKSANTSTRRSRRSKTNKDETAVVDVWQCCGTPLVLVPTATPDSGTEEEVHARQDTDKFFSKQHIHDKNQLPLWLQRYYYYSDGNAAESSSSPVHSDNNSQPQQPQPHQQQLDSQFPSEELDALQTSLTHNGFSKDDTQDILQTMAFYACPSASTAAASSSLLSPSSSSVSPNIPLLLGMIDFVQLIVAEHSHFQSLYDDNDQETTSPTKNSMHRNVFASKPVILAGIVHYAESIAARQERIYDSLSRQSLLMGKDSSTNSATLPLTAASGTTSTPSTSSLTTTGTKPMVPTPFSSSSSSYYWPRRGTTILYPPHLPDAARHIARSAATIKRAELLAATIMGVGNTRRLSKDEAEGLRGLLLSSMDDWRALALRCIASLFRLQGIQQQQQQSHPQQQNSNNDPFTPLLPGLRSPEVVHTAQEAILVYATLAQRLGMHQLKAKIEQAAFQILYQRQYRAVSSVYQQKGRAMHAIRSYLTTQIDDLLRSDEAFMAHIDELQISSRVKEPYSFWKKLLKTKSKAKRKTKQQDKRHPFLLPDTSSFSSASSTAPSTGDSSDSTNSSTTSTTSSTTVSNLSFVEVQDGIALRVVLKAKKATPNESPGTTRARERLLCYYVQHKIQQQWPGGQPDRLKDYIRYPKPNGYQSLHYTASLTYHTGQEFPFEVQVRSQEMHRIAEYGVAAHWDYKLGSTAVGTTANGAVDDTNQHLFAIEAAAEEVVDSDEMEGKADGNTGKNTVPESAATPAVPTFVEDGDPLSSLLTTPAINANGEEAKNVVSNDENSPTLLGKNQQLDYIDALVTARESLVQERVYVFIAGTASLTMEQGQLVILDSGSSIRDALEYMERSSPEVLHPSARRGDPVSDDTDEEEDERVVSNSRTATASKARPSVPQVWRNGQQAHLDETIRSGDVLLIEF